MLWFGKYSQDWRFRLVCLLVLNCVAYGYIMLDKQTMNPDAYFILPMYDKMATLRGYFEYLVELRSIDIQPVRDLSLFIDWRIFKHTGFNSFVVHNVLMWILACFIGMTILDELFPKRAGPATFTFGLLYSVYPLFTGVVSWGIARKHILALLFTLLATQQLIRFLKRNEYRHLNWMMLWYFLGVFSQPICILWPLWAVLYTYINHREMWFSFSKRIWPLVGIYVFGFTVNYLYYVKSNLFASIFSSKTAEAFSYDLKLLAVGHYFYQLFAPYQLAFPYAVNLVNVWLGYIFMGILVITYLTLHLPRRQLILWLVFMILPLGIILNTPRLLLDPYLLIPSFGLLVLLFKLYDRKPYHWLKFLVPPLLVFWTYQTYDESLPWTDEFLYSERNFERSPSCINAIRLARAHYSKQLKTSNELKRYLYDNKCLVAETAYAKLELKIFMGQSLFFEDHVPLEKKLEVLRELGEDFFYPKLVQAALLIKNNRESEAVSILQDVMRTHGNLVLDTPEDPIIPTVILPFCQRIEYFTCVKFARQVKVKREAPYL